MKLYVPDPHKWVQFFDRISTGKTTLNQSGSGIRSRIIPVVSTSVSNDKYYPIKTVLPAEQTTAQAKSELEREGINPEKAAEMIQTTVGSQMRGTKRKRTIQGKSKKGVKRQKRQIGGKNRRKPSPKRSRVNNKKKTTVSGKRDIFEIQ